MNEITRDEISEIEEGVTLMDGHDNAFIGLGHQFNTVNACYDAAQVRKNLMDNSGMTFEEAQEFYNFNIAGAYVGAHTPILLEKYKLVRGES